MPNFAGTWKMKSSENFEELLKALGKVKIESGYRCSSSKGCVAELPFACNCPQSLVTWETENKMTCRQTLLDGNGPKTYWTRELRGNELILSAL
ncbi:hypothetical protein cypCar_00016227 [Cyprinus carpio]|nr:hypothetical protein cypCar_00016227 [Cyprinus carpio]